MIIILLLLVSLLYIINKQQGGMTFQECAIAVLNAFGYANTSEIPLPERQQVGQIIMQQCYI